MEETGVTGYELSREAGDGVHYYKLTEDGEDGYVMTREGNAFTNTRMGKTRLDGSKTWIDGDKEHENNLKDITLVLSRTSKKPGSNAVSRSFCAEHRDT